MGDRERVKYRRYLRRGVFENVKQSDKNKKKRKLNTQSMPVA